MERLSTEAPGLLKSKSVLRQRGLVGPAGRGGELTDWQPLCRARPDEFDTCPVWTERWAKDNSERPSSQRVVVYHSEVSSYLIGTRREGRNKAIACQCSEARARTLITTRLVLTPLLVSSAGFTAPPSSGEVAAATCTSPGGQAPRRRPLSASAWLRPGLVEDEQGQHMLEIVHDRVVPGGGPLDTKVVEHVVHGYA